MKTRAAVAFGPGNPLEIVELDLAPPKKGAEKDLAMITKILRTYLT